jgi:hypothetical protein
MDDERWVVSTTAARVAGMVVWMNTLAARPLELLRTRS